MDNTMKDLHELCETIARAINTANEKIRSAGGKVSNADMEYLSLKSIKATIAMMEAENADEGEYSERGYSRNYGRDYSNRMYRGNSYDDGYSMRGRGSYAKRDSMGRYASDGYSRGNMADELRGLMQDAPNEQIRQEMQRLIEKMENR